MAAALEGRDKERSVLLIFRSDRYAFCAALLGALSAGFEVLLPAETDREAVLALAGRPEVGAVLHDTPSGAPTRVDALLETEEPAPTPRLPMPAPAARIRLARLGPQGDWRFVDVTWGALVAEARALGRCLGLKPGDRVSSALAPSQRSGLVLSVLAPLVSGAAFLRERLDGPAAGASVWVAVPAHLAAYRRAAASDPERAHTALASLTQVVNAAVPLRDAARAEMAHLLGRPVRDVLDDPELGALLVSPDAAAPFSPLPGVEVAISADGELLATTPWATPRATRGTGHRVVPVPGGLQRLGHRADLTWIAGAAVSLEDAEQQLRALPCVRDAALAVPERGPHAGQLLAWLDPEPGLEAEARLLARPFLSGPLEPARWLVRDRVPRDGLGLAMRPRLLQAFGLTPDGRARALQLALGDPELRVLEHASEYTFRVHIPPDYAYFDGHFPGYPILPGAAQLGELVLPCTRRAAPELGELRSMAQLKFLGRILPGSDVRVVLTVRAVEGTVLFRIEREQTVCATGLLHFFSASELAPAEGRRA